MTNQRFSSILISFLVCFLSCKTNNEYDKPISKDDEIKSTDERSLKNSFKDDFLIGAAISNWQIRGLDSMSLELLSKEFNSITPENDMKWENIHPTAETFNFEVTDTYVELGNKQNMHTVGHTLVWHSQLAPWMYKIEDKKDMLKQIENHINTIVGRYKGKIHAWDVVNEALNEDGTPRESHFYNVFGDESYIEKAFELASKMDPSAKLIYNDYNLWKPEKRKGVIRIVKNLQAKGVKIDAVGMQGHWSLNEPSLKDIEDSIKAYSALGVEVMITELDITALPNPWDLEGAAVEQNFEKFVGDPKMNPYPEGMSDEAKEKMAQRYEDIFKLFLKHKDKITRVTFWGVNDGQSWLNNWPIRGRTNYPLLFDRESKPNTAYNRVIDLKP